MCADISYFHCHLRYMRLSVLNTLTFSIVYIVVTVVILFAIEMFRFTFLFTLYGPVASDSFGLDERDSSYILLALGLIQIGSSVLL